MNIIERGKAFLQGLRELAGKRAWDWRRCPYCGGTQTCKYGFAPRHPWTLAGRQSLRVQRHRCARCAEARNKHVTDAETSPSLVRGSWDAREVRRCTLDHLRHVGSSVRRTAELVRARLGKQERWRRWRPLDPLPDDAPACHLSAGTVQRWVAQAGAAARRTVPGQLAGVPTSGQLATDGRWARLRGNTTGVLLGLVDRVTGGRWPPVTAPDEAARGPWARLFRRARVAGLDVHQVKGLASDGARGREAFRRKVLPWVSHQRGVFHRWRGLAGDLAAAVATAATGLSGAAAQAVRPQTRRTLVGLVRGTAYGGCATRPPGRRPRRRGPRWRRTRWGPTWRGRSPSTWTRRWSISVGTTRAWAAPVRRGGGAIAQGAPGGACRMGATMARTHAWSGVRRTAGARLGPLPPLRAGSGEV